MKTRKESNVTNAVNHHSSKINTGERNGHGSFKTARQKIMK
jgi:hypothetical protein